MKKILVPCDFSDPAVQAFKFAVDVATLSKGEIFLLNVVELPVMHDTVLMPTLSFEEAYLKDVKANSEKNFGKMISKWTKDNVKVSSEVVYGPTTHTIREFIKDKKIDLVVMGTHGASGLKEFVVGSNTEKIVRLAGVPVIAVKKGVKNIKNIVFPNNLRSEQEGLTLKVKALQDLFKASIHIVYINTPALFRRDVQTKKELADFAKRYLFKNYTVSIFNDIDEESGIINFARETKADLVAMGTHGRRGIAHLMAGSVAEDVVNHIECPIWTAKSE